MALISWIAARPLQIHPVPANPSPSILSIPSHPIPFHPVHSGSSSTPSRNKSFFPSPGFPCLSFCPLSSTPPCHPLFNKTASLNIARAALRPLPSVLHAPPLPLRAACQSTLSALPDPFALLVRSGASDLSALRPLPYACAAGRM